MLRNFKHFQFSIRLRKQPDKFQFPHLIAKSISLCYNNIFNKMGGYGLWNTVRFA